MTKRMLQTLRAYFQEKATLLGWTGAGGYFTAEALESFLGMALTGIMLVSSVAMNWQKYRALQNEERRKEELHRRAMDGPATNDTE